MLPFYAGFAASVFDDASHSPDLFHGLARHRHAQLHRLDWRPAVHSCQSPADPGFLSDGGDVAAVVVSVDVLRAVHRAVVVRETHRPHARAAPAVSVSAKRSPRSSQPATAAAEIGPHAY